jgi:hypothetical protein
MTLKERHGLVLTIPVRKNKILGFVFGNILCNAEKVYDPYIEQKFSQSYSLDQKN